MHALKQRPVIEIRMQPIKVLLIEDDPEYPLLLRTIAEQASPKVEVRHARTLDEAVRLLRYEPFDVVLSDLSLPDADMLEAVERCLLEFPNVPLVVLTGSFDETLGMEAVHRGAQDYLIKGRADSETILRSLRYAIERERLHAELLRSRRDLEAMVGERTTQLNEAIRRLEQELEARKLTEEEVRESHRRLEETLDELHQAQSKMIEQERLGALGAMASGIAHDFNNALSPIVGFTSLLLDYPEKMDDREQVRRYLQMMNTAAQDAAKIVRRLREFYRKRERNESLMPIRLRDLVEEIVYLTEPRWKAQGEARGARIHVQQEVEEVPPIAGNEAELREVLTNLMFNAVDAMPEGGTITIRTRTESPTHVVLEFQDTGAGMTPEVRRRCLEPFFTTKGNEGTGLGLAMVYGIITRHDGTLDIQSQPGDGTKFIVRFPVYSQHAVRAPHMSATRKDVPCLRILVADDEPVVRELVTSFLTRDGHICEAASDGREALAKFHASRFDLVITDRAMPDLSGDELAALIKQDAPDKPVIMLTGFGDFMNATGECADGVDLVLGKPVSHDALLEAIAEVVAKT